MGFGVPAAMGAKFGDPSREVIAIVGDGGFQMTLQELGTIAQEKLPVKIVILNNNFLGMVEQWQELSLKIDILLYTLKTQILLRLHKDSDESIFGIMMLWTAEGAVAMANGYLGSRKWRWTPVAVGLLICCGLIGTLVNRPRRPVEQGVLNPGFLAAVRYVHTLPDTVRISFNNPRLLALYTNHLTAWFPKGSPEQVLQFLDNVGALHMS